MQLPKRFTLKIATLFILLALVITSLSCTPGSYTGPVESVTIGSPPLESSALIYIAQSHDYFTRNGLDVIIRDYHTGVASLTGLLNNEVDIATPAEYALVGRAFQNRKIRITASIDKVQYFFLISRKDRGIEDVADLKGKKIGVVTKTIAEFYLGRFLQLGGMNPSQVELVNIDIAQSESAIISGKVDAIVSRPPYLDTIQKRLGENGVTWPVQSYQALYAVIIGRNEWMAEHPELVNRLLRSLAQAEEYIIRNPAEAKAILQKRLNVDGQYIANSWSQNQFSLTLDQSLILAMEDEARWMIASNLTAEKQVPDFLEYIYLDGLLAIKPEAVNVIR